MGATASLRRYTGSGAATESAAQTAIVLSGADALSGPDVAKGANSYECWLRVRLDTAPQTGVTTFSFRLTPSLPSGVAIKWGVADTPATPTAAPSTIATHDVNSDRILFDANTYTQAGQYTRYLVLQAQVAASASSGAIPQQSVVIGWQET